MLDLGDRAALELQTKAHDEGLDVVVVVVDRLTPGLGVQPVGERIAECAHAAADSVSGFEHDHVPARIPQIECRRKSREAGARDYDSTACLIVLRWRIAAAHYEREGGEDDQTLGSARYPSPR